jgi:hypothetical protein
MDYTIRTAKVHDSEGGFDAFVFADGLALNRVFHAETRQIAANRAAEWLLLGGGRGPIPAWGETPVSDAAYGIIPGVDDESYAAGWGER